MKTAAFFDLDKTIIARSSTLAFTRPMFKAGMLTGKMLAKAGIAQAYYRAFGADHEQMERAREELAHLIRGWNRSDVEEVVEETVDQVVAPYVYAEALARIESHRSMGHLVVVISASPQEVVKPLCRYLGIEDVIATRSEVDDEGRYTGEVEFYAYGQGKADAILELAAEEGIDLSSSYGYSDSATDLPMMEVLGHPIAVNPDAQLRAVAEERGWEIVRFERSVTLRDRLEKAAVPAGAAVATGVAAVLVYWALKGRKG